MLALEGELWCAILNYALSNTSTVSSDLALAPPAAQYRSRVPQCIHTEFMGVGICAVFHPKL